MLNFFYSNTVSHQRRTFLSAILASSCKVRTLLGTQWKDVLENVFYENFSVKPTTA